MHEMSLCQSAISVLVEQAASRGFSKVTAVWLEIGAFSCVEPEALEFCFSAAAKDSLAEGAQLHLIQHQGKAWCYDCGQTVTVNRRGEPCPDCGGYALKVAQDDNLKIKEIEVE